MTHTEDCIDANDDTSVLKGKCTCKMSDHTPGKWMVNIWTSGRYTIESDNGQVCEVNLIHKPGTPKANAERIAKAVNCHDALVASIEGLLDSVDRGPYGYKTVSNETLNKLEESLQKAKAEAKS